MAEADGKVAVWGKGFGDPGAIAKRLQQLDLLLEQALLLVPPATVPKPTRTMPSVTDLVSRVLDMETDYRILSAVAHAHQWALHQVSFRIGRDEEGTRIDRRLGPMAVVYMCRLAATAILVSLRNLATQLGWNERQMQEAIQAAAEVSIEPVRITPKAR